MSSESTTGERVEQLREHIENGGHPDSFVPDTNQDDDTDTEWALERSLYQGLHPKAHKGITRPQCDAIRCAAHDAQQATDISELFSFVDSEQTAYRHATGDCAHSGGVEPVSSTSQATTADECRAMRQQYRRSDVSQREISDAVGLDVATVNRHLNGKCNHE